MNGDAADPNTLDWWFDETPGSLGANDQHDPSTPAFQMQQVIKEIPQAQTLSDWHQGRVKKFEFEPLERMSTAKFAGMSDAEERKQWIINKLGRFDSQMRESAARYQIPIQLLAIIITNELLDIDFKDLVQEELEMSASGSYGIAQIQAQTAIDHGLVEKDDGYRIALKLGFERQYVKGKLRIPQFAIEAAAKEIQILLQRMKGVADSPWLIKFGFDARKAGPNQQLYDAFSDKEEEDREAKLAEMIAAAYNSPGIISAKDLAAYVNAPIHGQNAGSMARVFYRWQFFRP
jgi:hypothetical protein